MAEDRVQCRLGTILAADAISYSQFMEQDQAGMFDRLGARRMTAQFTLGGGN